MSNSVVLLLPATLGQGFVYFLPKLAMLSFTAKGSLDIGSCIVCCITAAEKKKRKVYTNSYTYQAS